MVEKKDMIEKELIGRTDEIKQSLEDLFDENMKITGWDVPEADTQEASEILVDILQSKLDEIREDVKSGKYE